MDALLDHALPVTSGSYSFTVQPVALREATALVRLSCPAGQPSDPVRLVVREHSVKLAGYRHSFTEVLVPTTHAVAGLPPEGVVFVFDLATLLRVAGAFRGPVTFTYEAERANLIIASGATRLELATLPALAFQDYHAKLRGLRQVGQVAPDKLAEALAFASLYTRRGNPAEASSVLSQISIRHTEAGRAISPMAVGSNPAGSQLTLYESAHLVGMQVDMPTEAIAPLARFLKRTNPVTVLQTDKFTVFHEADTYFGFAKPLAGMPAYARFLARSPKHAARVARPDLVDALAKLAVVGTAEQVVTLRLAGDSLTVETRDATDRLSRDTMAATRLAGAGEVSVTLVASGLARMARHFPAVPEFGFALSPPVVAVTEAGEGFRATAILLAARFEP